MNKQKVKRVDLRQTPHVRPPKDRAIVRIYKKPARENTLFYVVIILLKYVAVVGQQEKVQYNSIP